MAVIQSPLCLVPLFHALERYDRAIDPAWRAARQPLRYLALTRQPPASVLRGRNCPWFS